MSSKNNHAGQALKSIRLFLGWERLTDWARILEVDASTLSRLEAGITEPSLTVLKKMMDKTSINPQKLHQLLDKND